MACLLAAGRTHRLREYVESTSEPDATRTAVFMIGRGGGGHKASAIALRDCLLDHGGGGLGPWGVDRVELHDVGALVDVGLHGQLFPFNGDDIYNWMMKQGFYETADMCTMVGSWAINHNRPVIEDIMERFWDEKKPAIVVSFIPCMNAIMRSSLLRVCPDCWYVTVITDMSISKAHPWIDPWDDDAINQVVVAGNEELEAKAHELGYGKSTLRTSGMIVHPEFYKVAGAGHCATTRPEATKVVIFFGGFAPMRTELITRHLMQSHPDWNVVVMCGANEELHDKLQPLAEEDGSRLVVEGFIAPDKIREHFVGAACILGKPGPGAAAELGVCRIPLVVERRGIMSQEQCVLDRLEYLGTGVIVDDLEQLPADLLARTTSCADAFVTQPPNRAVFEVASHLRLLLSRGCDSNWVRD